MKLIVLKNQVPINQFEIEISRQDEIHEIYVGRSEDCHVLIEDPLISRHHFVLRNSGPEWYCEKISTLGVVSVNGNLVSKNKIIDGDEIKFGPYSILVTGLLFPASANQTGIDPLKNELYSEATPHSNAEKIEQKIAEIDEMIEPLPSKQEEELATEVIDTENAISEEIIQEEIQSGDDDLGLNQDQDTISPESMESESFVSEEINTLQQDESSQPEDSVDFNSNLSEATSVESLPDENDEGTRVFQAFVNYQLVLFGENAPYDRFVIELDESFIGRDSKKCQIVLDDPEVSSVHAVIRKKGNDILLEDLNSSNGTILNGERINKAQVSAGDEFIIGSTTFTLEVKSDLLDVESDRLMPVESNQVIETEEIHEEEVIADNSGDSGFDTDSGVQEKSIIKRILKDPQQRKKAIYALAGLVFMWVMFSEEEKDIPNVDEKKPKDNQAQVDEQKKKANDQKKKLQLSQEQQKTLSMNYELGVADFDQQKYFDAHKFFQEVIALDPDYKRVQSYFEQTKEALRRIEELEKEKRLEAERIEKKKQIEELLVKAREAVKDRKVQVAESFFTQIVKLDPDNIEISQLKLELEAWQKEEERKALEEAAKINARKKMVDQLTPGKTFYLKKEWYRAILKLEEFMKVQGMDEDLLKEGSEMLSDSKNQLASEVGPIIGKARSLKEGQDLKNAYDAYLDVLKVEPTNAEALNEVDDIKFQLESKSKKIYREAIISESLSLFTEAKEKFQEVQQISPTDSEYYKKANEKLKNYLE